MLCAKLGRCAIAVNSRLGSPGHFLDNGEIPRSQRNPRAGSDGLAGEQIDAGRARVTEAHRRAGVIEEVTYALAGELQLRGRGRHN